MTDKKKSRREAGQEFLKELLGKHFSDDERKALEDKILGKDSFLDEIGDSTLRQSDYSRNLDALRLKEKEAEDSAKAASDHKAVLDQWYADNLEALEAGRKVQAGEYVLKGATTPPAGTTSPTIDLKDYVRKNDVETLVSRARMETEQRGAALIAVLQNLGFKHSRDFNGEILDVGKLYETAAKKQIPLESAYDELTRDRYDELHKKSAAKAREDLKKELAAEILADQRKAAALPYSTSTADPASISPLSGLNRNKKADPEFGVQAALDEFYRAGQRT